MITLQRSYLGRMSGSKPVADMLLAFVEREQPFIQPVFKDNKDNEFLVIEKQFWLKYKKEFQQMGFLPERTMNSAKKIPQMLEKF